MRASLPNWNNVHRDHHRWIEIATDATIMIYHYFHVNIMGEVLRVNRHGYVVQQKHLFRRPVLLFPFECANYIYFGWVCIRLVFCQVKNHLLKRFFCGSSRLLFLVLDAENYFLIKMSSIVGHSDFSPAD